MMSLSSRLGAVTERMVSVFRERCSMPPAGKEQSLLLVRFRIGSTILKREVCFIMWIYYGWFNVYIHEFGTCLYPKKLTFVLKPHALPGN